MLFLNQRWEFIKDNKKVRKKERKHALDQENDQEENKGFRLKNVDKFYFQPLSFCHLSIRPNWIHYIYIPFPSFFFLDRFLGRKRFFFIFYFLVFFNSALWFRNNTRLKETIELNVFFVTIMNWMMRGAPVFERGTRRWQFYWNFLAI